MEKKIETTKYRAILGLYKDNGKENGNYYNDKFSSGVRDACICYPRENFTQREV